MLFVVKYYVLIVQEYILMVVHLLACIQRLEDVDYQQDLIKEQLLRDQRHLQHTLSLLSSSHYRVHSVSECSTLSSAVSVSSVDSGQ